MIRAAILVVGILATLMGLVWLGQGSGYFPYPAADIMINQAPWLYRGLVLALFGVTGIVLSQRL